MVNISKVLRPVINKIPVASFQRALITGETVSRTTIKNNLSNSNIIKDYYAASKPWGMIVSINAYNCNPEIIRSKTHLTTYVDELVNAIKMHKHGPTLIEYFGDTEEVEGLSLMQFIKTSSITGHFANKTNAAYIDVFSCKHFDPQLTAEFTADFFKSTNCQYTMSFRD